MRDSNGATSLMLASTEGHTESVSLLLVHGAHVNAQDDNGVSSLMLTSLNGCTEQF